MLRLDPLSSLRSKANLLVGCPFLAPLSAASRMKLLSFCHSRSFRTGEHIYDAGDPAMGFYFILQGRVKLESPASARIPASVTLHEPDVFGILGLTSGTARSATAISETDSHVLGFFRPDFEALKSRQPRLALNLFQLVHATAVYRLDEQLKAEARPAGTESPVQDLRLELLPDRFELLSTSMA
jgi:CRP-like cAMP-binding protein